jgi:hypothetical protein
MNAAKKLAVPMEHETLVIDLEAVQPPALLDLPDLGAQEHVDPEAAAKRILAAHQAARGNSSSAARLMGITYQGLRRAIHRFDLPRRCPDGVERMIQVFIEGRTVTLDEAVQFLHAIPNRAVLAGEVRIHLTQAVNAGVRLVDIARRAKLDATRLTKFRSKTGSLTEDELQNLLEVVAVLRGEPVVSRPGRRAATD